MLDNPCTYIVLIVLLIMVGIKVYQAMPHNNGKEYQQTSVYWGINKWGT